MKNLSYIEFANALADEDFFDEYIQESYWTEDFKTSKCLEFLESESVKRNVILHGLDDFDYDKFFHELYQASEKGLS